MGKHSLQIAASIIIILICVSLSGASPPLDSAKETVDLAMKILERSTAESSPVEREALSNEVRKLVYGRRELVAVALPLVRSKDKSTYERARWLIDLIGAAAIDDLPAIIAATLEGNLAHNGPKSYAGPGSNGMLADVVRNKGPLDKIAELAVHDHQPVREWALSAIVRMSPDADHLLPAALQQLNIRDEDFDNDRILQLLDWHDLGERGMPALPYLLRRLKSSHYDGPLKKHGPVAVIVDIGPAAVAPLLAEIESGDSSTGRLMTACLAQFGKDATSALPRIRLLLDSDDERLQVASAYAVWKIAGDIPAIAPTLIAKINSDTAEKDVISALHDMGPQATFALEALVDSLSNQRLVCEKLGALGAIGPAAAGAMPALVQATNNDDDKIVVAAAYAVRKVDPTSAAPVEALCGLLQRSDPPLKGYDRKYATIAIGNYGPLADSAIPVLVDELGKSAGIAAANALVKIGPAALPALKAAANSEDENTRDRARMALDKFEKQPTPGQ